MPWLSKRQLLWILLLMAVPSQSQSQTLADLDWLAGGWTTASEVGQMTEEHWTPAAGSKMFGVNRTFTYGRPDGFEHMVIESRPEGLFYLAMPGGHTPAVAFRLTECRPGWAAFENPEHDFPKRVTYEKLGPDKLRATVSAGNAMTEWNLTRIR